MPCGSSVVVAVVRSGSRPEGLQDESTAGTAHLGLREEDRDAAVGWHDVRARARSADPAVATDDVPELSLLDVDTAAGAPRLPVQEDGVGGSYRWGQLVGHHLGNPPAGQDVAATGPSDEHGQDVVRRVVGEPLPGLVNERELADPGDPLVGGAKSCGRGGPWFKRSNSAEEIGAVKSDENPSPLVERSRSRTVTGRTAGTVSSSAADGSRSTRR